MHTALPQAVADLADWSSPAPFTPATVQLAPRQPGVYLFSQDGRLVYVGRAGERGGHGLRGRLRIYVSGRAPHSGVGNLALERALQDPDWLRVRLAELDGGQPSTVQAWAQLAVERADLTVQWATTATADDGVALERAVLDALADAELWNRLR